MPCFWSEEKNLCIDDDACHPTPLSPPLRQPPAPPSPPPPSLPCRAMGSTRKPGPATQLQLSPLPGSCEFAIASWLPLQDAAGCNGALQQVEVRPAVAGDWTQAVVETVHATACLCSGWRWAWASCTAFACEAAGEALDCGETPGALCR